MRGRGGEERAGGTSGAKDLSGAEIAIVGLGASGRAAARLALAEVALTKGGTVYVSDVRADDAIAARGAELRELGADVEWGGHDVERVASADLVVVSPGIGPDAPVLRTLADRGVGWVSEPDFAVRFFRAPLIGVTGTNGKTTTTMAIAHLLNEAGLPAAAGGNVGGGLAPPASELALMEPPPAWYVLELSSFQLGATRALRTDIGVVTNLSPDHLDRYADVDAYYADKARLFARADARSVWVLPGGDPEVERLAGAAPGRRYRFAEAPAEGTHAYVAEDGRLTLALDGPEPLLDAGELPVLGRHNRTNALAAALAARLAGADAGALARGLATLRPLPHRLEPVGEWAGVRWVNDSKATNVAATRSALTSLPGPVVLLAGGKDKGEDFRPLRSAMSGVRVVVAYGAAGDRLARDLSGSAPVVRAPGAFDDVVRAARAHARPGDVVLLSPACSSFDMFRDYEERGRRFAELAGDVG